ncbi:hypothetical protein OOK27_05625 [Streptomyces canus]|uniref:hypothetical protein n=1 Tax=Streptomyces canus TaxID=58343 RepID=UPI0022530912|nr:hypothetical protein [Streptomyces canus]MCX5253654.1 hypothetical protein [Streptomyces canus]
MAEALNLAAHTGLVVQPYRADDGSKRWVFRCWGTDTCDGALSLDHDSERSAIRALTSHYAEAHAYSSPEPDVEIHITSGLTEAQRGEVERIVERCVRQTARGVGRS